MEFIYEVVTTYNSKRYEDLDTFLDNHLINAWNDNPRQREELQEQPIIDGCNGPMYGGKQGDKVVIRYESYKAYQMYSD